MTLNYITWDEHARHSMYRQVWPLPARFKADDGKSLLEAQTIPLWRSSRPPPPILALVKTVRGRVLMETQAVVRFETAYLEQLKIGDPLRWRASPGDLVITAIGCRHRSDYKRLSNSVLKRL